MTKRITELWRECKTFKYVSAEQAVEYFESPNFIDVNRWTIPSLRLVKGELGYNPETKERIIVRSEEYPTHFACSLEEQKLLERLRQLRRKGEVAEIIVNVREMSLKTVGDTERLAR